MNLRRLAIALLAAGCCAEPAAAALVQSAVFFGTITASAVGTPYCTICEFPYSITTPFVQETATLSNSGSAMVDTSSTAGWGNCHVENGSVTCSFYGGSQAIIQMLLSGGPTPTIDLSGAATNGTVWGWGSIAYFFRVDKLVADAPDAPVPIFFQGTGELPDDPNSYVRDFVTYQGPTGGAQTIVDRRSNDGWPHDFHYSIGEWLEPGKMAKMYMYSYATSGAVGLHSEFQSVLDPSIEIMPGYTIYYNGQYVAAQDLYTLSFSPEMLPPDSQQTTPEPASLIIVGLGFVFIWWRSRPARGSQGGWNRYRHWTLLAALWPLAGATSAVAGTLAGGVISGNIYDEVTILSGTYWSNGDGHGTPSPLYSLQAVQAGLSAAGVTSASNSGVTDYDCEPDWQHHSLSCHSSVAAQGLGFLSMTAGRTPTIIATGDATGAEVGIQASIRYDYDLLPRVADAPNVSIPIDIVSHGTLAVGSNGGSRPASAYVIAALEYSSTGSSSNTLWSEEAQIGGMPSLSFTHAVSEQLSAGESGSVTIRIDGRTAYNNYYLYEGSFSAFLDPEIYIDPSFLVWYQGSNVPATDLYSLEFSPGFGDSAPEPVPVILAATGLALIGLGTAKRSRRLRNTL